MNWKKPSPSHTHRHIIGGDISKEDKELINHYCRKNHMHTSELIREWINQWKNKINPTPMEAEENP